ncbi:MAG: DUF4143 domain-containing protein, partial [Propionibacteriaceae bacterium]|nr:DUF4143 domain-containing protein [Propionibacteriaceae bacterium]
MTDRYSPRVVDAEVDRALRIAGGVLIEGARACGKTATGRHHAASWVQLDTDTDALDLAQVNPRLLLDGATPRLIDEWQLAPTIWNHVRRAIDDRQDKGLFLLAGSAAPADDVTRHSGAGRILRLRLRPMTLFESGHSSGAVSLAALLESGSTPGARSEMSLEHVVDRLCVGGWPGLQDLAPDEAQQLLESYLVDVSRADILTGDPAEPRRDPVRVARTLAAYARHVSTPASLATIARGTGGAGDPLKPETVSRYLSMLQRVMVVEELPSWGPHLRSRDVVRQAATRHFTDPSLAAAALHAGPDQLLRDLNTLGLLFESLVVRDLRVYAQARRGTVSHYRDSAGAEADAVITLPDGRWALVEIKLSVQAADQAVASLDRLVGKLDLTRHSQPPVRLVITAGEHAYTRPDGAVV